MSDRIANLMTSLDVTKKGAERIADIVKVGAEILLEEGFPALTKRRIAKKLGISHGNVSYYFPTRDALWQAVVDYELKETYQRHNSVLEADPNDPQACFDEVVLSWIDEYKDRIVRIFYSHMIAFAEVNETVAKIRDEIYESFFAQTMTYARALKITASEPELEQRVLEVMVLMEGLQVVSAFRPALVEKDDKFRQRLLDRANAIIRGE
jgi:AcrR family transcriptional regulator